MPTQCVPDWRCGAALSGWLKGGHPTLTEGEISSKVCFTRGGDCCKEYKNIYVKDFGSCTTVVQIISWWVEKFVYTVEFRVFYLNIN